MITTNLHEWKQVNVTGNKEQPSHAKAFVLPKKGVDSWYAERIMWLDSQKGNRRLICVRESEISYEKSDCSFIRTVCAIKMLQTSDHKYRILQELSYKVDAETKD